MISKIAVLVLAHAGSSILSSLTRAFESERYQFYVHVDSKTDQAAYQMGCSFPQTTFCDRRYPIYWGGFNMIRATLGLIDLALEDSPNECFCLISDDSYPLFDKKCFFDQAVSHPNRIDFWPANEVNASRYSGFYFFDGLHSSARWQETEKREVKSEDIQAYKRLEMLMAKGKRPIRIFTGSQWWMLSRDLLSIIRDTIKDDAWLKESFEFSAIPDEQMFQSLFKEVAGVDCKRMNSPMLYDFTRDPKPFVFRSPTEVKPEWLERKLLIRKVSPQGDLSAWLGAGRA